MCRQFIIIWGMSDGVGGLDVLGIGVKGIRVVK